MSERAMNEREVTLTHDEKKAAEAAFRGAPFDPAWSHAARRVYQGISAAMAIKPYSILNEMVIETTKPSPFSLPKKHKASPKTGTKIW